MPFSPAKKKLPSLSVFVLYAGSLAYLFVIYVFELNGPHVIRVVKMFHNLIDLMIYIMMYLIHQPINQ
uniref:Uncharacterized protein n=1 Tax=Salix viminalis TaxID=40686 RepID=A0A6N2MVH9_SALVM